MKRLSFLAGLAVAAAAPAFSAPQACVNTRLGYEARPVGTREVMVRNSLGEHRAELRLTTTCFAMNREDAVRIDALSTCVETGDRVFVSTFGGGHQACRVTGVGSYDRGRPWDSHS